MTSAPSDRYRHWLTNQEDAYLLVSAPRETFPVKQRSSSSPQRAIDLIAQIVAALRLWLFRLAVSSDCLSRSTPQGNPLKSSETLTGKMHTARSVKFGRLDETELTRVFDYCSLEGPLFRNCIEDILTQLFGNSWNTRGRKASLVGSLGGNVAVVGFVLKAAKQSPDRRNQSYEHGYRLRRMG